MSRFAPAAVLLLFTVACEKEQVQAPPPPPQDVNVAVPLPRDVPIYVEAIGETAERFGIGRVQAQRFLDEGMFAGFERAPTECAVRRGWCRDHDRIDGWVSQQGIER